MQGKKQTSGIQISPSQVSYFSYYVVSSQEESSSLKAKHASGMMSMHTQKLKVSTPDIKQ